ncbi:hypothetical protein ACQP2F_04255 [Actinoplanes sp. CA-030573]|uniref:hypothetical protein n=1 Tax=Actinoplanes sp. CA-030573 TaxID=3239898 RepID=UPI003D9047AB
MRGFSGARHVGGAILAVVLAVSISIVVADPDDPARVVPAGAATAPPKPKDPVRQLLSGQAKALDRGDLAGWLAPVDPTLREKYQNLFRTLRALRATVDFRVTRGQVELAYCFDRPRCPADSPRIAQRPTVEQRGRTAVVTGLTRVAGSPPTPWEQGDLVFAQGRRVTVGAPRALRGRLKEVVAVADQAAAVDDRFAAFADNRQPRYRIFLATKQTWRIWYGGKATEWAVGYMQPLGPAGADVVINPARLTTRSALREVIQHELGHVATISGVTTRHEDMWLVEGVAEYIGMQPRTAPETYSRNALRRTTRIAAAPLPDGAGEKDVAAFYAEGHFAVSCLVNRYGEARAMEFVRLRLRRGNSLENASRSVFGRPFADVDRSCAGWISNLVVTRR